MTHVDPDHEPAEPGGGFEGTASASKPTTDGVLDESVATEAVAHAEEEPAGERSSEAPEASEPGASEPGASGATSSEAEPRRFPWHRIALLGVLALCAVTRFQSIGHDLPNSYYPDEIHFVKRSVAFGSGDPNPHWFHKPAFLMYLLFVEYGVLFVWQYVSGAIRSVDEALVWLGKLRLPAARREAVEPVLEELVSRLDLIQRVGLGYLTLDRSMATLSGGESRRIRLSASLGSQLVGVCYVLDEPTVGLHPADIDKLTDALCALRDGGNTVLVVEHDEALMQRADHVVDLGPGAGRFGGEVVVSGTPEEVAACEVSQTGKLLRGEYAWGRGERAEGEEPKASAGPASVGVRGAALHNLRQLELDVPFGQITGVCGPSGSGKSTLVLECLVPALLGEESDGRWSAAEGEGARVVVVDAQPLGRTPKSVPATAVGLLDPLRELFARLPEARMRGLTPASFSFNSTKGRCRACEGSGATKVEMQFLADLWLECEECGGARYRPEVLEVRLRGRSIADVLAMSVDEAADFLEHQPKLARILATLRDVGLGYLSLGQSSTTLSAGEAQRVKLASELLRARGAQASVVVLDEPSTGLAACDVEHLVRVLARLADRGDAVLVIEHHVGLLGACDQLVELGPAGGSQGGRIVATGTPAELAVDERSITGPWLVLEGAQLPREDGSSKRRRRGRRPRNAKEVVG